MARHHLFSSIGLLLCSLYAAIYFDLFTIPPAFLPAGFDQARLQDAMAKMPFWALSFVAIYCLLDIVTGVLGIEDASEAKDELMKDVAAAKKDLNSKGIKVE